MRSWLWIVGGAVVAALVGGLVLPDWAVAIGYGVGVFVGRSMSNREFVEAIERLRA